MVVERLELYSPDVNALQTFYKDILGCTVVAHGHTYFEIEVGHTLLHFQERPKATPYHFAINIPSNQIENAKAWLRIRVDLLPGPDGDIVDFSSWKAKSVYFYDADQNIVELIARERIAVYSDDLYNMNLAVGISEIGMPVSSIKSVYQNLCLMAPFPVFSGSFDMFCAVGDDEGLFIIIDKNKKDWFPSNDTAHSSDFSVWSRSNDVSFSFRFQDGSIFPFVEAE